MNILKFVLTRKDTADPNVASATITTGSPDRDDDMIDPGGVEARGFQRNPSVLWAHDYSTIPVGACTDITAITNGLRASWRWLEGDAFAARVRNAWNQGVLNACSIGFRPLAWEPLSTGGKRFTKWELLEFSIVPVPANAEAVRTLKALNLWRENESEIVLDLADDGEAVLEIVDDGESNQLHVTQADVAAALPEVIAACIAEELSPAAIRRAITDELLRRRGRVVDGVDPLGDHLARRLVTPKTLHGYGFGW